MKLVQARAINEKEAAVILAVLSRAPLANVSSKIISSVPNLRVIGRCDCGCDSIEFEQHNPAESAYRLADGIGYLSSGDEIGVLVWATADEITGLEVYNYSDELPRLPEPESLRPYEECAS